MSEKLHTNSERSAESAGSRHLEVLTEMSDQFDPDRARHYAEAARPESAERHHSQSAEHSHPDTAETHAATAHTEVMTERPEKPVEDLSPEEASREYLDLLMDLSTDFTSAEGKSSRVASYDRHGNLQIHNRGYSGENSRIVGQLYETATGKNFRDERNHFEDGKWQDPYIDRELALSLADNIISAESDWRAAGESTSIESEQTEKATLEREQSDAQAKLDKINRGIFGKLKKAFYVNFRNKEYNRLHTLATRQPQTAAEADTSRASAKLQKALEAAYSADYGYGKHQLSPEHTSRDNTYADQINTEYNDRFFSPDRQAKIDRAIAIRRKLQADKLVKN